MKYKYQTICILNFMCAASLTLANAGPLSTQFFAEKTSDWIDKINTAPRKKIVNTAWNNLVEDNVLINEVETDTPLQTTQFGYYSYSNLQLFVSSNPAAQTLPYKLNESRHANLNNPLAAQTGWTTGLGLEYTPMNVLVLGLQYDFIKFNSKTLNDDASTSTVIGDPFNIYLQNSRMRTVTASISIKIDELFRRS